MSALQRGGIVGWIKSAPKSQMISCLSSMNATDLRNLLTTSIIHTPSKNDLMKSKVNFYSQNEGNMNKFHWFTCFHRLNAMDTLLISPIITLIIIHVMKQIQIIHLHHYQQQSVDIFYHFAQCKKD